MHKTMFSAKFKNPAVRAAQKSLDSTFDNLGNKIKELNLSPEDEKTIIDIIDKTYTVKALELRNAASRGEVAAKPKKERASKTVDPGDRELANTDDDLNAALGTDPGPAPAPKKPAAAKKR